MKICGIDPGSSRTGYGCIETDGRRYRLVIAGTIDASSRLPFPERLAVIHDGLARLFRRHRPEWVAVEDVFYARNVRSALKLGHARGVVLLAACRAGLSISEYTPTEIKSSVVGYGHAEKRQVQQMVKLLLGLDALPSPHDVADALAVAICHGNCGAPRIAGRRAPRSQPKSWRHFRP